MPDKALDDQVAEFYRTAPDDIHIQMQPAGPPLPHRFAWTQEKEDVVAAVETICHEHIHHTAKNGEAVALVTKHLADHKRNAHPSHEVVQRRVLDVAAHVMLGHVDRVAGGIDPEVKRSIHAGEPMPDHVRAALEVPDEVVEARDAIRRLRGAHRELAMAAVSLHRYCTDEGPDAHQDALNALEVLKKHTSKIMPLPVPPIWHHVHERTRNAVINKLHFHGLPHHSFEDLVVIVTDKLCAEDLDVVPAPGVKSEWSEAEDATIRSMRADGKNYNEIAERLAVNVHTLILHAAEIGVRKP